MRLTLTRSRHLLVLIAAAGLVGTSALAGGAADQVTLTASPNEGPPGTDAVFDGSGIYCSRPRLVFGGAEQPSKLVRQTARSVELAATVPDWPKEGSYEVDLQCVEPDGTYVTVATTTFTVTARPVTVPALRGMTLDDAIAAVHNVGLTLNATTKSGRVTEQRPPAGTQVAPGTAVVVTLEDPPVGPALISVPDLRGKQVEPARSTLAAIGLILGGDLSGEGLIVDQRPAPGTLVPAGTSVTVALANPPAVVRVPALISRTPNGARAALNAADLPLAATVPDRGRVVAQHPAAGILVRRGTPVAITVADVAGARWTVVPALRGMTPATAHTTVAAANLTLAGRVGTRGRVVAQDPAAGTRVLVGTPIAVTVHLTPPRPWPIVAAIILVLAALVVLGRMWRRRRARRWVNDHIVLSAQASPPFPPHVSLREGSPTMTHAIRLETHDDEEETLLEEVHR